MHHRPSCCYMTPRLVHPCHWRIARAHCKHLFHCRFGPALVAVTHLYTISMVVAASAERPLQFHWAACQSSLQHQTSTHLFEACRGCAHLLCPVRVTVAACLCSPVMCICAEDCICKSLPDASDGLPAGESRSPAQLLHTGGAAPSAGRAWAAHGCQMSASRRQGARGCNLLSPWPPAWCPAVLHGAQLSRASWKCTPAKLGMQLLQAAQ